MLRKNLFRLLFFVCLPIAMAAGIQSPQGQTPTQSPALQEATKLNQQVVALFKQGKYAEALPLAKRCLELREKELPEDDRAVRASVRNLATIYRMQTKYYEAASHFRRLLKIEEKVFGVENTALYDTILDLAWVSHGMADARSAEPLFKRALALREKAYGPEATELVDPLFQLATFYQKNGYPEKSLPLHQQTISIITNKFGAQAKELVEPLERYACALRQCKKHDESGAIDLRIIEIATRLHPTIINVSGGVLAGRATHRQQPPYPDAAKQARIQGPVFIKVEIDEAGLVTEAKVVCGADLLSATALEAARKWRFEPTKLKGEPVKVSGILTFNFTLQ